MGRWAGMLGSVVVAIAAGVGAAHAASVSVTGGCQHSSKIGTYCNHAVEYAAAPGEANRLSRGPTENGETVIRDEGAPLVAGDRCRQIDAHAVACPPHVLRAGTGDGDDTAALAGGYVNLGEGNDRFDGSYTSVIAGPGDDVVVSSSAATLYAGPGDDRVTVTGGTAGAGAWLDGDVGDDVLMSSIGNDTLIGGPGSDVLDAGEGDDVLPDDSQSTQASCAAASDRVDGGPGRDRVSYSCHSTPVTVDLADPGPDGAEGENDALANVEGAYGGRAPDLLTGDAGPSFLAGGPGGDLLRGGDGDDHLEGGEGGDVLEAGPGDDTLSLRTTGAWYQQTTGSSPGPDEKGDRGDCGEGADFVFDAGADLLLPGCEVLELALVRERTAMYAQPRFMTANKAVFALRCPKHLRGPDGRCRGRLFLSSAGGRMERRFAITGEQVNVGVRRPPGATTGTEARVRLRYSAPSEATVADYLIQLP